MVCCTIPTVLVALSTLTALVVADPVKLDFKKGPRSTLSKRQSGYVSTGLTESSTHFKDYFIEISIGTPPQKVSLVLDTGSSDLLVISKAAETLDVCQGDAVFPGCADFGVYAKSQSSTYVKNAAFPKDVQLAYGSAAFYAQSANETIHLGGLEIPNMAFFDSDRPGDSQGIMGIGFETGQQLLNKGYESYSITDQLVVNGYIHRRAFSLYLDDQNAGEGSIIFGGVDPSKYTGDLIAVPIIPLEFSPTEKEYEPYRVAVTSISFNGADGSTSQLSAPDFATPAVLDSGTSDLFLPAAIAQKVYDGIGAIEATVGGSAGWVADCAILNSEASLSFQFGGSNGPVVKLPMSELLDSIPLFAFDNGVPACMVSITASSESTTEGTTGLLFGDPLMRNAYFVYDLDNYEIAIAQANYNQTGTSDIKPILRGVGLPGVSLTATGMATRLPIPSNSIASGTGGFISQETAPTGIPASAKSPTFSLGIAVATTGSGVSGLLPSSLAGGASSSAVLPSNTAVGTSSIAAPSNSAAATSSVMVPTNTAGTVTTTFVPSATFTGVASGLHSTESIKTTAFLGMLVAAGVFAGMLVL